jgi:hypothetical protein
MRTVTSKVFKLANRSLQEVDIVKDEALFRPVLERLDHSNGDRGGSFRKSSVGRGCRRHVAFLESHQPVHGLLRHRFLSVEFAGIRPTNFRPTSTKNARSHCPTCTRNLASFELILFALHLPLMSRDFLTADVSQLIQQLSLDEKIALLSAPNWWNTTPIKRLAIPSIRMSDGPNVGIQLQISASAVSFFSFSSYVDRL